VVLWPNGYLSAEKAPQATLELIQGHLNAQRDAIREFALKNAFHFLDRPQEFQAAAARGTEHYYLTDTHWNQDGHRLAARTVAAYLKVH